jgi:hypothetical protein
MLNKPSANSLLALLENKINKRGQNQITHQPDTYNNE